jgi:hypothetical protein
VTGTLVTAKDLSLEFENCSPKKISRLLTDAECEGVRGDRLFLWSRLQAVEIIRTHLEREAERRMRDENRALRRASSPKTGGTGENTEKSPVVVWGAPLPQIRPFPGSMESFRDVVREKRTQSETFWG